MKSSVHNLFALVIVLLTTAGCYSAGNSSLDRADASSIDEVLVEGVTTKAEVMAAFGNPMSMSPSADGEIWMYQYTEGRARATDFIPVVNWFGDTGKYDMKQLTILFYLDGTVRSYTWNDVEDMNNQ